MTTRLRMLITAALASGVFVAGCAQANPENNVATPSPSASEPVPRLSASPEPTGKPTPGAGEVTLTGMVERLEIEGGCLVLRADTAKTYELKGGDPNTLKAGSRVTVTGKVRSDIMTVCQVGPVLEVISSRPA